MNTAGYTDNRALFDNIATNQAKTVDDRKAYATAYGAASGGSGSEAAREALVDSTAGPRALPPEPPRKPTAPDPYTDPRLTLNRDESKAKSRYEKVYRRYKEWTQTGESKYYSMAREEIADAFGYTGPLLTPERMDELAATAAKTQAQYDTDIAEWDSINSRYQDNLSSATEYNTALESDKTARAEGEGISTAKAAAAGRQGGGGSGELGVSQGAKNMSPGLGLVKRPESVWL